MSVVSFEFLGFLAALAVVYYVLPMRVRKWALLAGSAAFWLLCGWQGAAYLTAETLLIWGCARLIGRFSERRGVCRALLVGGMVTVFGAMVLMKALSQLQALPDGLLVPIGLSYFTFQSVGYLIDVYRGKVTPEKNYAKVLLFAGFFPQMTQGPITTWKQLMPQMDSPHRLSPNGFVSGVFLMAWGFFKKLVIADRLMPAVSMLVATAQELPGWLVLATAAMYAIVLYADFSGGIDIIRGAATLAHQPWRVVPHLFAVPAGGEPRWNRAGEGRQAAVRRKGRARDAGRGGVDGGFSAHRRLARILLERGAVRLVVRTADGGGNAA